MRVLASRFTHIRYVKRSLGGSACKVAAYNARTRITCQKTGRVFDFRQRSGLAHHSVLLPPQTSQRFLSPEFLWNVVEQSEKRKDSQVAKELLLRLPESIPSLAWMIRLVQEFMQQHFVAERIITQVDIHKPPYQEGLNWHAHILMPLRRIDESGLRFLPYKASDLEPCLRGAHATAVTTTNLMDKWSSFLEYFCAENHFPILTAAAQRGHLLSEGPRYRQTSEFVKSHNETVRVLRAQHSADPLKTIEHLLHKKDLFSVEDLTRFWGVHTPEETLRHEFLKDLVRCQKCVSFGVGQTHLGLFSSHDLAQRLPQMYDFIRNHPRVTFLHEAASTKSHMSVLPQKPSGRIFLQSAHHHTTSALARAISASPHAMWSLQGCSEGGVSSALWGAPQHAKVTLVSENTTLHIMHLWHKAFARNANACLITQSPQEAQTLTNTARLFLKNTGLLDQRDIYVATPQGPKPFARKERVLHDTGSFLIPATIQNITPTSISLTSDTGTCALETNTILPLTHAYVRHRPPLKTPSFALYTPPLTPPSHTADTLIVSSTHFFKNKNLAQCALYAAHHKAWSPHLNPIACHSFEQQLIQSLEQKNPSLDATFQRCLQHTKHLPPGVHHLAALKTLYQHIWSQGEVASIALSITPQINFFIASWKSAHHPITPPQVLRIEHQFFSGTLNNLWCERHHEKAFVKLLSLRHATPLTPQQERWALLATQKAFCETPHNHSWAYWSACHHQDWCFYHLMHNDTIPNHPMGSSAFYTRHLQHTSHALFNSTREHKCSQHQLY